MREIYFHLRKRKELQQVAYAEFQFIFVLHERKPRRQKASSYLFRLILQKVCFYCECTK